MNAIRDVATSFLYLDGRVLILKRSKKVGTFKEHWAAISGTVEDGETPTHAALREIEEETGLSKGKLSHVKSGNAILVDSQEGSFRVFPFLFRTETENINLNWEHSEYAWISKNELGKYKTVPKLAETLNEVLT